MAADRHARPGGRYHKSPTPNLLPAIYIKETRLVSQSFVHEKKFQPQLPLPRRADRESAEDLPPLYGFVRTTPKQSPLVEMPIETPKFGDQEFPILAYWQYGLGKSVAFTSDARSQPGKRFWDRDWAELATCTSSSGSRSSTGRCARRESKQPEHDHRVRDGKVKRHRRRPRRQQQAAHDLDLKGGVTSPSGKAEQADEAELKFEQKNSGVYEAEFKADEAGSYFINVQACARMARTARTGKDGKPIRKRWTASAPA